MDSCSEVTPADAVLPLFGWRKCCGAKATILIDVNCAKGILLTQRN